MAPVYWLLRAVIIGLLCSPFIANAASLYLQPSIAPESALLEGDELMVEVFLRESTQAVQSFQLAFNHDPSIFQVEEVVLNEELFSIVMPSQIDPGRTMIGAGALQAVNPEPEVLLATIRYTVLSSTENRSTLSMETGEDLGVFRMEGDMLVNILSEDVRPEITWSVGSFDAPSPILISDDEEVLPTITEESAETTTGTGSTVLETEEPSTPLPIVEEEEVLEEEPLETLRGVAPEGAAAPYVRYSTRHSQVEIGWEAQAVHEGAYVYYSKDRSDRFMHRRFVQGNQAIFTDWEVGQVVYFYVTTVHGGQESAPSLMMRVQIGTMTQWDTTPPLRPASMGGGESTLTTTTIAAPLHKVETMPQSGFPIALLLVGTGLASGSLMIFRNKI